MLLSSGGKDFRHTKSFFSLFCLRRPDYTPYANVELRLLTMPFRLCYRRTAETLLMLANHWLLSKKFFVRFDMLFAFDESLFMAPVLVFRSRWSSSSSRCFFFFYFILFGHSLFRIFPRVCALTMVETYYSIFCAYLKRTTDQNSVFGTRRESCVQRFVPFFLPWKGKIRWISPWASGQMS